MHDPDYAIETSQLSYSYGKHRGIDAVDLTVAKGEVFGFLGPNGAGKTTTLRLLLDVIRPKTGTASIFGYDCQKEGIAARQHVGYLPGELALPGNMRGRSYLNMLDAIRGKADADYRRQLYGRLDLDISRRIREYSRGNKQKLGLIAAMMHKPDVLILDEPTSGLDPLVQQTVLDLVRETREEGRTVFFSSHNLPEVQAVCDRAGIIRNGRLVAVESVNELLHRSFHRIRLWVREPIPNETLLIEGVKVLDSAENRYTVEISQNLDQFMWAVAGKGIIDIETLDLSLEEVFLAYYGKGADNHV
ncbi:MAG: ABC transporter ATP-binding protein [Anaerolineae bacterium]|nr:ABC transporter ATP-binding protein [Anaerolineae bacterium]